MTLATRTQKLEEVFEDLGYEVEIDPNGDETTVALRHPVNEGVLVTLYLVTETGELTEFVREREFGSNEHDGSHGEIDVDDIDSLSELVSAVQSQVKGRSSF